jgi:hypothetical protein
MRSADTLHVQVALNGDQISGLLRASIMTTNHFSADTFALTFALDNRSAENISFWSNLSSGLVEVVAVTLSESGLTYQSLITGMIDNFQVDPVQRTIGLEGRDLSSSMIDSYRQQDFVNQTASEIVVAIAQYHNLGPVVTSTSGNVGRYYSDGYTKLSLGQFSRVQSDWDLVVQLARLNDFDVFVGGQSLYFQPSGVNNGVNIIVSLQNVESARIERSLSVSPDTIASVQSWNSQNMASYNSTAAGSGTDAVDQSVSAGSVPFLFSGSNYTSQQVTDAADRYTAELVRLRTVLHLGMPWDLSFMPRATCLLQDTDSMFDTVYRIESVERQYCSTSGSRQSIQAVQI